MQRVVFRSDKKEKLCHGYYMGVFEISGCPNVLVCNLKGESFIIDVKKSKDDLIFITPENNGKYLILE